MQTGKLDQTIELQSNSNINDGGQLVESYTTYATVSAYVITQKGGEAIKSAQLSATQVLRVLIRYRADTNVKDRFIWEGQNYEITDIDRTSRRSGELWFTAQSIGAI